MNLSLKFLLFCILFFSFVNVFGQTRYDELHLKYFDSVKGRVLRITNKNVEFRIAKKNLIYDYNKKDIDYIILSDGTWIKFTDEGVDTVSHFIEGKWGYFSLSGGAFKIIYPNSEKDQRKIGYSVNTDLNYMLSSTYSLGLFLNYSSSKMKEDIFLRNTGLSNTSSSAKGGTLYFFTVGLINRFYIFPSAPVNPVISFSFGYSNLLISEIEISNRPLNWLSKDFDRRGVSTALGFGLNFKTGERGGFTLFAQYNRFFYKKNKLDYSTVQLAYILPIY